MNHCVKRSCPVCGAKSFKKMMQVAVNEYECSDFPHHFDSCNKCGFVCNARISSGAVDQFYHANKNYLNENAAGAGGCRPADLFRYTLYSDILVSIKLPTHAVVVDVGAAKGGFVEFLTKKGFVNVKGGGS